MKRFSSYLSAALAVLFVVVGVLPASAATLPGAPITGTGGSAGLSIQPRKNYVINPGGSVTDKLTIGNLSDTVGLNMSLRMIDFTYTNQSGTPKLNLATDAPQTAWSLRPFTTLPSSVDIPESGSKTIQFTIKIPKNLGAGSYYSAILYQAGGANGGNVALNASGATLVFVSVPGTVKENMTLQKFGAYTSEDNGNTGGYTFIATSGAPKMVAYTLKNEGNVFESPAGTVTIKDMFGHKVADVATNANQSLALLGQARLFTSCIKTVQQKIKLEGGASKDTSCTDPHLLPGRYSLHLDVFYGQNGNETKEITSNAVLWVLPWWFVILVLILAALAAFGIWRLQRRVKAMVKGTTYKAGRGISRRRAR